MKNLFKTKSFVVGAVAIVCGTLLVSFSSSSRELGIAMITSGLGSITLKHVNNRRKKNVTK
jgi:hypothetical protein